MPNFPKIYLTLSISLFSTFFLFLVSCFFFFLFLLLLTSLASSSSSSHSHSSSFSFSIWVDYGQWFWVCNFGGDSGQIFPLHGWWFWGSPLTAAVATSSSSTPCSSRRSIHRSKHRSTLFVFVGVSVCGCVWFCGVCSWFCGWLFYFCGWFSGWLLILCLWECVYQRKKKMMRALVLQMEKREKKWAKLEIIKIMYRTVIVTVHIYTVTVALVHLCTILHPLMWVFFCQNV